jgi:hypothetical protein
MKVKVACFNDAHIKLQDLALNGIDAPTLKVYSIIMLFVINMGKCIS